MASALTRLEEVPTMNQVTHNLESNQGPLPEEFKDTVLAYVGFAREWLAVGSGRVKDYVVREPVEALGIAFLVGVILGSWVKRR
jgi:ElaB/YqjD/DUF883 family membrane-anchored ribosome-binding protein